MEECWCCIPAVPAVALFPQVFSNLLKAQQLQLEGASNSTAAKSGKTFVLGSVSRINVLADQSDTW